MARVAKLDHSTERRSCRERRSIGGMGTQEGKLDLVKGIARVKGELHHYTERRSWRKREPRNHKGKTSLVKGFSKGRGRTTLPYEMEKLWRKEKQRDRRKRIETIDIEKMEELEVGVKKGKPKAESSTVLEAGKFKRVVLAPGENH